MSHISGAKKESVFGARNQLDYVPYPLVNCSCNFLPRKLHLKEARKAHVEL